ncbi:DMT family transporter [Thiotrichales bacterium 19S11-10]|nr:DMT family transporter [Thiotrichales bacterium 19S11-10]MCF6808096.1 DMT family transporter [Thiotrichales bacterium 19S9-11]MCF6812111.1 DMT family transporter [Thiotrichales bacterium 19S9-12]
MRLGIIFGVLSGFLWGLNDVLTNLFSLHFDMAMIRSVIVFSLTLAFIQDSMSALGIFSYYTIKKDVVSELKKIKYSVAIIVIAAIFAGPMGMVAGILGISYAGPVYAGVITSCYPIVALVLSFFLIRERVTKLKIIGVLLSVFSVVMISVHGSHAEPAHVGLGMLFAAVAMLGWGMESVLFAWVHKKTNMKPMWLLAVRQAVSAISYLLILSILLACWNQDVIDTISQMGLPILVVFCVLSASFSYILYYHTIKRIGAALGTTFNASFVFWAAIFSELLGLSQLGLSFWLWSICLIIGIYLAVSYQVPKIRIKGLVE